MISENWPEDLNNGVVASMAKAISVNRHFAEKFNYHCFKNAQKAKIEFHCFYILILLIQNIFKVLGQGWKKVFPFLLNN